MMLLGIVLHAAASYSTLPFGKAWPYKDPAASVWFDLPLVFIHVFRMPIFFVLAGFFARMLWEKLGEQAFLRQRAQRILLPFVVGWLVLVVPVGSAFQYGVHHDWGRAVGYFVSGNFLQESGTMHLWFLYYLMYFYAATAVLSRFRLPNLDAKFGRVLGSRWRPLAFAIPTAVTLYFMDSGALDTEFSFFVRPKVLAAYGVFYWFGWMLKAQSDLLPSFQHRAWTQILLALAILPINGKFVIATIRAFPQYDAVNHAGAVITGSVMVWLLIFGLMGVFLRYFQTANDRVRYLADASYWMYLTHFPFTIWIPVLLSGTSWPAVAKFLVVLLLTTVVTLVSYSRFVRNGAIGRVLNGSKASVRPRAVASELQQALC